MQTLYNAKTGQSIEWNGTLDDFYAASDANQAGEWAGEAVAAASLPTLVPFEISPAQETDPVVESAAETAVEPTVEVHTEEAQSNGN